MDISKDKSLRLCMFTVFAKTSNIPLDSVKNFLKQNAIEYDSEILEYYFNNMDLILQKVSSELDRIENNTTSTSSTSTEIIEKKEEVKPVEAVDFSAFF